MRFVTNDGSLPSSMIVRTPPVQIYTSTLRRSERAWHRGGRDGVVVRRGSGRRRRVWARDLAIAGVAVLVVAVLVVAVLAPTAS
jgi:hypothetical protein